MIALEAGEDEEWIAMDNALCKLFEWFVGVFMLLLGLYGVRKAIKNKDEAMVLSPAAMSSGSGSRDNLRRRRPSEDYEQGDFENVEEDPIMSKNVEMRPTYHRQTSQQIIEQMAEALNRDGDSLRGSDKIDKEGEGDNLHGVSDVQARIYHAAESLRRNSSCSDWQDDSDYHNDKPANDELSDSFVKILTTERPAMRASILVHKQCAPENSIALDNNAPLGYSSPMPMLECPCCKWSTEVVALLAGIIHGVAGPGGVLGVIPAVQLRDTKLACIYLSTFCLTSTLVMGGFAVFYGTLSEWLAAGSGTRGGGCSRVFMVEMGSALLSIGVGVVWLVLLSVGKLQEVFP